MFKLFWVSEEKDNLELKDWIEVELIDNDEEISEEVWQVALDVLETKEDIIIIAPIAWVEYEDIDLSLNRTVLTIKWKREQPKEYQIEWVIIRNSECFWWKFVRNVILPENLALNKIRAYMENNLLVITIPKLKFDSKNIKINRVVG